METLPPEMVEKVSQHLTPQELANCCSVSRVWREVFNHDWLWEHHCDPGLEEYLLTIPSVAKPMFVVPGGEDSTLTPIGQWRLAFMRGQHLWGNWKKDEVFRRESFSRQKISTSVFKNSFLTDTLLAVWHSNSIEIWDISLIGAVLVAKTNSSVGVKRWDSCSLVGNRVLIVKQEASIQVFLVDLIKQCVELKHEIHLDQELTDFVVKQEVSVGGTIVFGVTVSESNRNLTVLDLEKEEKIEERCLVMENKNAEVYGMKTSPLSEVILILIKRGGDDVTYNYSPKQLRYLSGPLSVGMIDSLDFCAINKHYVALGITHKPYLVIVDYLTSEVIFKNEGEEHFKPCPRPLAYKDSFIFLDYRNGKYRLQMFSLTNKTITTIFEYVILGPRSLNYCCLKIVNDKFVIFVRAQNSRHHLLISLYS